MYKRVLKYLLWTTVVIVIVIATTNLWVVLSTQTQIYNQVSEVPVHDVALVLGTSKNLVGGYVNPYFKYRMEAVAKLYHANRVSHIILSGDNRTKYYNEPLDMQRTLAALGVPEANMTLDYAGLRTLDSVVRCDEIFGQSKFIIISQKFHLYRALFIANHYDLEATAFTAQTPKSSWAVKTLMRELLARPKAILDLFFLNTQPKYRGKKEVIKIR